MFNIRLSIRKELLDFPPEITGDPKAEKWLDPAGRECGFALEKDGQCWMRLHDVGAFVAQPGCSEVLGFLNEGVETGRFQDIFLRLIAPRVLQRHAWECLHASAVLTDAGVVAFCGPSGRGKSTLARSYRDRGASVYADDALPFLFRSGIPMAARFPQNLRLRGPAASWFCDVPGPAAHPNESGEIQYDFQSTLRPLSVIYWLEPTDLSGSTAPVIERIAPLESFGLLLSEAYCLTLADPICNRKMVRNYLSLVQLAPVFRLSFPCGLERIPALLDRLDQNQQDLYGTDLVS